ncbi:hypothetical protein GF386_03085 [Candidatus Pacearchaeota archaeon]|nr:hypothetical protein [Candidatus Pacearchaeota archaeon]MBD3283124.1 hypothetical protein [Candidatus Pacearchaeota archaeon]
MKKRGVSAIGDLMVKIAIGIAVLILIVLAYVIISGGLEGVKDFFRNIWWFGN